MKNKNSKVEVTEQQVKAYKSLLKMGATEEDMKGLVSEETFDAIKLKIAEEEQNIEQDIGIKMGM